MKNCGSPVYLKYKELCNIISHLIWSSCTPYTRIYIPFIVLYNELVDACKCDVSI